MTTTIAKHANMELYTEPRGPHLKVVLLERTGKGLEANGMHMDLDHQDLLKLRAAIDAHIHGGN